MEHAQRRRVLSGRRKRCSTLPGQAQGVLESRTVEAQAVSGEQLGEMVALVVGGAGDVADAARDHSVPVPVVGAEAGEALAELAAEIRRGRVVGLEAREDCPRRKKSTGS
jgi:hypothetical protein